MGEVIITKEIAFVGMKVKKGRDWVYDDQDTRSSGTGVGTIKSVEGGMTGWLSVQWDGSGITLDYRVGNDNKFDLYLYKPENPILTESTGQSTTLTNTLDLKVGDKLKFTKYVSDAKYCAEDSKLQLGSIVTISTIRGRGAVGLVEGKSWSFSIECFSYPSTVEIVRADMENKTAPKKPGFEKLESVIITNSGLAAWGRRMPNVGDSLYCIITETLIQRNYIQKGQVIKITEVNGYCIRTEGSPLLPLHCFVPAGEYSIYEDGGRSYFPLYNVRADNKAEEEIISKPIKTSKNGTEKSTVSVSRGECGYAFKVSRPAAKIKRGKGPGQIAIRSRRSEA